MKNFPIILLLALVPFSWAGAQDVSRTDSIFDLSLEELLKIEVGVSSTKADNVFKTPSTVSVLDADLIRRFNFQTVAEALRMVAGMDVYQTNIDRDVPTARGILQNYYSNKMLLMINGIPTWQPVYGNASLDRVDINEVERIEVLRGPASVLYGTNAFTGVINLVLKSKADQGVSARAQMGLPEVGTASFNVNRHLGDWKLFASASSSTERFAAYPMANDLSAGATGDPFYQYHEHQSRSTANIQAEYNGFSVFANAYSSSFVYPGINITLASGGGHFVNDKGAITGLRYDGKLSEKLQLNTFVSYDYFERDWAANAANSVELHLTGTRVQGSAKLNYSPIDALNIELGTDGERGIGTHRQNNIQTGVELRKNMDESKDIVNTSVFGQVRYALGDFSFLAGTRLVNNNLFGTNLSSRFTAVYAINETNSVKAIWGNAYRAPSMLELYFDHPTVVGNPNLVPEQSSSAELAYLTQIGKFFLQANAYFSSYSDMIRRVGATLPSTNENVDAFDTWGTEWELKFQDPDLLVAFLNYNYMVGVGEESEANFNLVPKHTIRYGVSKPIGAFAVGINGFVVSGVKGVLADIEPQHYFDLHLSYQHQMRGSRLQHTLSLKNAPAGPMLTPQYIRPSTQVNVLETMGYGRRLIYTFSYSF